MAKPNNFTSPSDESGFSDRYVYSLYYLLKESLGPRLLVECTVKALVRLDGCHGQIYVINFVFVAVFLGCTSTGRVGLCVLWFNVQELLKAQPAVVLILKHLRRRNNGLKSHPTDCEKPGIEPYQC